MHILLRGGSSSDSDGAGASNLWASPGSGLATSPTSGGSGGFRFHRIDLGFDFDDGFWILLVLGLMILVIAGAGGYLIWAAPEILPDLAFSTLLSSCLIGAAKCAEAQGWMVSVVRATFIPLLLILRVTIGLAVVVHRHGPSAAKLSTALSCPNETRPPG